MVRRSRLVSFGIATAVTVVLSGVGGAPASASSASSSPLILVLDASGSMWGQIDGENKIVIARRVLASVVGGLAEGAPVGLVAYGHRREADCQDIETVAPLGPLDKRSLVAAVNALNPKGKTPITLSVERALEALAGHDGPASVVLVSDGLETCGGDPCATVRAAKARGVDFRLHVVGFDVAGEDTSQLECAAQAGDGLFFSADDADQLASALEAVIAVAPEVPAGRLSVKVVRNGELHDAAVLVTAANGDAAGGARTYRVPETNPRRIPLADGAYDVEVSAIGIRGDSRRRFAVEIAGGATVEKELDFSTGEVWVGATRNGELSDAGYQLQIAGTDETVASGRTYRGATSNPAKVSITAGTYDLVISSIEIAGRPEHRVSGIVVEPQSTARFGHEFASGSLSVGAVRNGELVDATVEIALEDGGGVAAGRTYTNANSNPKVFVLEPGRYRVTVKAVRPAGLEPRQLTVIVTADATVAETVDFGS